MSTTPASVRSGDRPPAGTGSDASGVERGVDAAHPAAVARFIGGTAALFLVGIAVWGLVIAVVPSTALQWKSVVVTSGSMTPALQPGDLVIAQPTDTTLTDGTVAVFRTDNPDRLVTHRITTTNPDGTYTTKGDANPQPDSTPLDTDHIVGTGRLRIPYLGTPLLWLRHHNWAALTLLTLTLAALTHLTRYALRPQHDPWATPTPTAARATPHRSIRPWTGAGLCIAAFAAAIPLQSEPASAAFSATTVNGGNAFFSTSSFCPGTVILTPIADATGLAEAPTQNFGSIAWIGVRGHSTYNERAFVKFDLPPKPAGCSVLGAELTLTTNAYAAGRTHDVRLAAGPWAENTLTWNNKPGLAGPSVTRPSSATTQVWDVTPHVAASYPTNNGFVIKDTVEGSGNALWQEYRSRESATPPLLKVAYG